MRVSEHYGCIWKRKRVLAFEHISHSLAPSFSSQRIDGQLGVGMSSGGGERWMIVSLAFFIPPYSHFLFPVSSFKLSYSEPWIC